MTDSDSPHDDPDPDLVEGAATFPESIIAAPDNEGERLDRFLAQSFASLSRSRIKNLILDGMARRGGVTVRDPSEPVRAGASYALTVPEAAPAIPQAEDIPLTILYEDADLVVLDKPAGLVVHPAPGNYEGTLVNALLAHCGESLTGIGGERRPGIVHRLDKETSGVMVAAKTELAHARLSETFANRDLDRHYLALCWGTMSPPAGDIDGAIGRDPRDRKRMAVRANGGRAALTHYSTLQIWRLAVSLLDVKLSTGRTHQIRVHLATATHPVIGDPIYLRRIPAVFGAHAASGFPAPGAACGQPRLRPSAHRGAAVLQHRTARGFSAASRRAEHGGGSRAAIRVRPASRFVAFYCKITSI
jgi:23S rRNA pseudouridine1911/1915/1917 synthase